MIKIQKKNNLLLFYRFQIFERFIKLRYTNNLPYLRFFFSQFYNKKLIQIINNYNNSKNFNKNCNNLFFINVFKYKLYINLNDFKQFLLILKNKFKFKNYFIINLKNQIIIGTQDNLLYNNLLFEINELKKKIIDEKYLIIETSKLLVKIQHYVAYFYSSFFFKNLDFKNFLNNIILIKFLILFLIFFIYYIIFYIQIKNYYGYIKAINKRLS